MINTLTVHHSTFNYRVGEYTKEDADILMSMKLQTLVSYITAHDNDVRVMEAQSLPCFLRKQAE